MILDERTEFADGVSIAAFTALGGDQLVGDVIDLEQSGLDIGNGQPIYLMIQVDTAVAGTSSTVEFKLASDAAAAIATDGSATVHYASGAIAEATLVAGYQIGPIALPQGTYERYLGIQADVGAANLSAGVVSAFLTLDPHGNTALPDAVN